MQQLTNMPVYLNFYLLQPLQCVGNGTPMHLLTEKSEKRYVYRDFFYELPPLFWMEQSFTGTCQCTILLEVSFSVRTHSVCQLSYKIAEFGCLVRAIKTCSLNWHKCTSLLKSNSVCLAYNGRHLLILVQYMYSDRLIKYWPSIFTLHLSSTVLTYTVITWSTRSTMTSNYKDSNQDC